MASLGHIAVGMAAARIYRHRQATRWSRQSSMAIWSVLSLVPDADVIGFGMGVAYADPWGHRGATHSLAFSMALGLAVGLAARLVRLPALRTGLFATAVLVSHALLDTLTDGGLGCALLWPFDLTRYFAPWNPIPVAPIGLAYFSRFGFMVALAECVLFAPVFVGALWPARIGLPEDAAFDRSPAPRRARASMAWLPTKPLVAVWIVLVWFVSSHDSLREDVVGHLLREDTQFAGGFSEASFRAIEPGRSDTDVRRVLGPPLGQWIYPERQTGCLAIQIEAESVVQAIPSDMCDELGIAIGSSLADVYRLFGPTSDACWAYSRSPGGKRFRVRGVCFSNGKVVEVIRQWYLE